MLDALPRLRRVTQVLDDMNKARTDDLADIQPNLAALKPKLV